MGSFWDKQHLSLQTSLQLMLLWAFKTPVTNIEGLIGVAEKTAIQWFEYYRGVCSWWLNRNPRQIGGPGVVVEIDESLMAKRNNNVGHVVQQRWVFGAVCLATNEGFLQFVPDRTAGTLLPLIQRHIAPGSVIHSDGHGAYNTIATLPVVPPFQHLVVIHNQNFVDPVSGACTNHVECYWKNAKRRFKSMAGVHNSLIESHLDEFMWREIHGKSNTDAWLNIKRHIAMRYPTP